MMRVDDRRGEGEADAELLNSTVIVGTPLVAALLPATGTGNSPPARKLAVCPFSRGQVRLGQVRDQALLRERVDRGADRLPTHMRPTDDLVCADRRPR